MVRLVAFSIAAAVTVLASTAHAYRPGDEICTYASSGSSCSLSTLTPSTTDGSVLIYPGGKTRCAFDDYTDPTTTFRANATYFFQVFPKPQKTKLALILQGGGACVDQQTCNFALQCSLPTQLVSTRALASSTGILNATDTNNAFNDWNIVHVPYCTGDLHVGDKVLEPFESGLERLFGRPQCLGLGRKTYLNGFENTKAAFQWAKTNYPDVEELVIGGMSAGSLGAQALTAYAADLWSVKSKGVKYGVLADSYIGVLPPNKPAGQVLNFYGGCNGNLLLPDAVAAQCTADTLTITQLSSAMLQLVPESAWLFVNSMGDATQRLFYQLCKDGIAGFPFANQISPADYFAEVTTILDAYKAVSSRVSTFIVSGTQHVFLNSGRWYTTTSVTGDVLGATVTQWLASLTGATTTPTSEPTTVPPTPTPTTTVPTLKPTPTPTTTPEPTTTRPAC